MSIHINTRHSRKLRETISDLNIRRGMNTHVADMMSITGVYNLLSKADLQELVYRWTAFNSKKMNERFFIDDVLSVADSKGCKLELTTDILISYLGAYLPFKRLSVTRDEWEKQHKYVFKVLSAKRGYDVLHTAQIIAACVTDQVSIEDEAIVQKLAEWRINDMAVTSINLLRFNSLLDKLEADQINEMLKTMFPNTRMNIQLGLELIHWYWLYLNGMILEEVDNPKCMVIDSLFSFEAKLIKRLEPDYTIEYLIAKYHLEKIKETLQAIL